MKRSLDDEMTACAWHEAGHAVTAIAVGVTLHEVWIAGWGDWRGRAHTSGLTVLEEPAYDEPDFEATEFAYDGEADDHLIIMMAGAAAETALGVPPDVVETHLWSDRPQLLALLPYASVNAADLESAAADVVRQHWQAVSECAELLLERHSISGADVEHLVMTSTPA